MKPAVTKITVEEKPIDTDEDGIYDYQDNCQLVPNADQKDTDAKLTDTVTFTKKD
jgi:hypothetical protein